MYFNVIHVYFLFSKRLRMKISRKQVLMGAKIQFLSEQIKNQF